MRPFGPIPRPLFRKARASSATSGSAPAEPSAPTTSSSAPPSSGMTPPTARSCKPYNGMTLNRRHPDTAAGVAWPLLLQPRHQTPVRYPLRPPWRFLFTLPLYPLVMLAILIEDGRPFFFTHTARNPQGPANSVHQVPVDAQGRRKDQERTGWPQPGRRPAVLHRK